MSINLNEITEEYAELSFEPCGAHYKKYSAGHRESEYHTRHASFIFAVKGKAEIYLNDQPLPLKLTESFIALLIKGFRRKMKGHIPLSFLS